MEKGKSFLISHLENKIKLCCLVYQSLSSVIRCCVLSVCEFDVNLDFNGDLCSAIPPLPPALWCCASAARSPPSRLVSDSSDSSYVCVESSLLSDLCNVGCLICKKMDSRVELMWCVGSLKMFDLSRIWSNHIRAADNSHCSLPIANFTICGIFERKF